MPSLSDLLISLGDLDRAAELDLGAEEIVGEIAGKVDAIHVVLERLGNEADRLDGNAAAFSAAAKQVRNNAKRLKDYVLFTMRSQEFDKIPGKLWRLQRQATAPSLVVERSATADDAIKFGELVVRKVDYRWDAKLVKDLIEKGGDFPLGKLQEGETIRFYVNKGKDK